MRLPSAEEKKRMLKEFRLQFIGIVNEEKTSWEELSKQEKKEVDKLCEKYFDKLNF